MHGYSPMTAPYCGQVPAPPPSQQRPQQEQPPLVSPPVSMALPPQQHHAPSSMPLQQPPISHTPLPSPPAMSSAMSGIPTGGMPMTTPVPTRMRITLTKLGHERSFGMTLEQQRMLTVNDFPRISHVFADSAAGRAGIQRGWTIEAINGRACHGLSVQNVAMLFRNHQQITLDVDTSTATTAASELLQPMVSVPAPRVPVMPPFVPPPRPPPSTNAFYPPQYTVSQAMTSASMLMQPMTTAAMSQYPPQHTNARSGPMHTPHQGTTAYSVESMPMTTHGSVPTTHSVMQTTPVIPNTVAALAATTAPPAVACTTFVAPNATTGAIARQPWPQQVASSPAPNVPRSSTPPTAMTQLAVGDSAAPAVSTSLMVADPQPSTTALSASPSPPGAAPAYSPPAPEEATTHSAHTVSANHSSTPAQDTTSTSPQAPTFSSTADDEGVGKAVVPVASAPIVAAPTDSTTPECQASLPRPPLATATTTDSATATSHVTSPRPSSAVSPSQSTTPTSALKRSPPLSLATGETPRSTGKKRGRSEATPKDNSHDGSSNVTTPTPTAKRKARSNGRRKGSGSDDYWDEADAIYVNGSSDTDASSIERDPSPPPAPTPKGRRRYSTRGSSESGGRTRKSLTVDRLVTMGFKREDAEASVLHCGHDPDKCMLWIVSHLEEKQFINDLNKASIESEMSQREEEKELKKQESETIKKATAFTSLFPTSYILSSASEAPLVKAMLAESIGAADPDSLLRTLLSKLLKLEAQAIKWYKQAARCYMLQLGVRLEIAFQSHDVESCCATFMPPAPATSACGFVRAIHEETSALNKALFHMPENHGGVPMAFLRADESMQFSLDDDGFEVVDVPVENDD